jgi:hypothetical protein
LSTYTFYLKEEFQAIDTENFAITKLIEEQHESQDKIANEMLKSVKAIKENSLLANRILKTDNKVLFTNYYKNYRKFLSLYRAIYHFRFLGY